MIHPTQILDRQEACRTLHISRQTLISWIRKGKLKVWKRVGQGTNAALLFERAHIEMLAGDRVTAEDQTTSVKVDQSQQEAA